MKIRIEPQLKQSLEAKIAQVKAQFIAEEWKNTCNELESIYSIIKASEICEVFPSYHLTYTCMPVFCAEDYKEAVLKA